MRRWENELRGLEPCWSSRRETSSGGEKKELNEALGHVGAHDARHRAEETGKSSMRPWAMLELTTRDVVRRREEEHKEALGLSST